jgi:serine/threonine protein kinase
MDLALADQTPELSPGSSRNAEESKRIVQDIWGETLTGDELPEQTIRPPSQATPGGKSSAFTIPTLALSVKGRRDDPEAAHEIISKLGEGGMGTVYLGQQRSMGREIAIKQLKKGAATPETEAQFLAEARATGYLDHPNIVPVYDVATDPQGNPFYTMKRVRGVSWKNLLHPLKAEHKDRAAEMEMRDHMEILLKVCDAMAYAHDQGILHKDLKPENVMVGDYGEVLVMDWGLSATFGKGEKATEGILAELPNVSDIDYASGTSAVRTSATRT